MKKILLFLAVLLIAIFTAQSWAETKELQVLGFTIGKAKREEVRKQLKDKGVKLLLAESVYDKFSGNKIGVDGLAELEFWYGIESDILASVIYSFDSSDAERYANVLNILKEKYGKSLPRNDDPLVRRTEWIIGDYRILLAEVLFPKKVTLFYEYIPIVKKMQRLIDKELENQKRKEIEKQKDKF